MAFVDDLSDSEIDFILERFDLTDPALQRRTIAEFVIRGAKADALEVLLKSSQRIYDELEGQCPDDVRWEDWLDFERAIEHCKERAEQIDETRRTDPPAD